MELNLQAIRDIIDDKDLGTYYMQRLGAIDLDLEDPTEILSRLFDLIKQFNDDPKRLLEKLSEYLGIIREKGYEVGYRTRGTHDKLGLYTGD